MPDFEWYRGGLPIPPVASIHSGGAGIAFALYRLSLHNNDAGLLSLAYHWSQRADASADHEHAFYSERAGLTRQTVGEHSLYHTTAGIRVVQGLIGHAMGSLGAVNKAIAWLATNEPPIRRMDLVTGDAGILLGCALLVDIASVSMPLRSVGNRIFDELLEYIRLQGHVSGGKLPYLGVAHGWGGILYALITWCIASGREIPPIVEERLVELIDCSEPVGTGVRWARRLGRREYDFVASWCNGCAGFAILLVQAATCLSERDYLGIAERSANTVWHEQVAAGDLCCGLAGGAYALLSVYRGTGDAKHLSRARRLYDRARAAAASSNSHGLFKGRTGVMLLGAEMEAPSSARFPLFEREGWNCS
jgi:serine/threonine-protein kinase